ncbi:MAG TPA: hypothetical protein VF974_00155 [Patescibacteria group bacterium]
MEDERKFPGQRKEMEEELAKLRRHYSDMNYDLENGRYPQGVPPEYHTEMEETKREIERLEGYIKEESRVPSANDEKEDETKKE